MRPRRPLGPTGPDARIAVARAIQDGVLPPLEDWVCCVCYAPATAFHHWSYLVEHHLDVVPVCDSCHGCIHAGTLPEPRTGRHRPIETQTPRGDSQSPRYLILHLCAGRTPPRQSKHPDRWAWAAEWLRAHPEPSRTDFRAMRAWKDAIPKSWADVDLLAGVAA